MSPERVTHKSDIRMGVSPCRRAMTLIPARSQRLLEELLVPLAPQVRRKLRLDLVKRWCGRGAGFEQPDDVPAIDCMHGLLREGARLQGLCRVGECGRKLAGRNPSDIAAAGLGTV